MFKLANKEQLETSREARYKAECAMADSLDMLSVLVPMPVKNKAEKVYCYCNLDGKNATFVAFYTVGDKAVLHSEDLGKSDLMEFNMAVMSQLVYLKTQYEDCPELMPSELFLEFEPNTRETKALAGMERFTDPNDTTIRSLLWYKEHGGKLARTAELAMKMGRFKARAEAMRNPTANAVAIDKDALNIVRKYVAGEAEEPALHKPETGWDAVRAEMARAYKGDTVPMSFESDDGKSWVDVYDGKNCWHYVSCGLSSMGYAPEAGSLGAEYTLSLKKKSNQDDDDIQIFAVLNLMRAAIDKAQREKTLMADYEYIAAEGAGLVCVPETKLNCVEGPAGTTAFKKLVCIGAADVQALEAGTVDVQSLCKKLGDVSDYRK